jgi:hypothetical protein
MSLDAAHRHRSTERVESGLAAINSARNQLSTELSLAQASADQKIVL